MQRIGRYEVREEIGRGGFGRVYRSYDPTMKREVAIKVMAPSEDPESLGRFRNEAASAGALRHENIITIFDFGEEQGVPYIVMEYLQGLDLQKILDRKTPLALIEKMRILCQVAAGLQKAHAKGVIHRDVKPANIMVLPDRTVKIMDFGIARLNRGDATRHTRTGFLVGTLQYLSPEQFEGQPADTLADLWAFGVIAYELLSGTSPFQGTDAAQTIYRITSSRIASVRAASPEVPDDLAAVVNRLLDRDRAARHQSFEDLRLELTPILERLEGLDADRLVDQARVTAARGDLNGANQVVRQVLERHPSHRAARELRDQIVAQLRAGETRQQMQDLLKHGDDDLAAGRFEQAATTYEQACRLNPVDSTARIRLERAREMAERALRIREGLNRARAAEAAGAFPEARAAAAQVLEEDPGNPEAGELQARIDRRLGEREEAALADAIMRARTLAAEQRHPEALAVLEACARQIGDRLALREAREELQREAAERGARDRELREMLEAAAARRAREREMPKQELPAPVPVPSPAALPPGRGTRRMALASVAAVVLIGAGSAWWRWGRPDGKTQESPKPPVVVAAKGPEPETKPEPPPVSVPAAPPPLSIPAPVAFEYQKGGALPRAIRVPVNRTSFEAVVRPARQWLRAVAGRGELVVSVAPQGLAAGGYAGQVEIASGDEKRVLAVTLRVTQEVRPPAVTEPVTKEPVTTAQPPPEAVPSGPWLGDKRGSVTWTGSLPPGGRLVLGSSAVQQGGGQLTGSVPLPYVDIAINQVSPAEIRVEVLPAASAQRLVFTNAGTGAVNSIRFRWNLK